MPTRTVSNSGGNYNAVGTWVEGAVPTSADDVVFTATSGNLTINVTSNCRSINFTNYVGTVTFDANLGIAAGGLNLGTGGYTQAGTGGFGFSFAVSCSITSNGVICSRGIAFGGGSQTYTLVDNFDVASTFISATTTATINGAELRTGSIVHTTTATVTGTSKIVFNKTGSWTHSTTGIIQNNFDINLSGTLTISGTVRYRTGTLSYITGTVSASGGTLLVSGSATFNTNGMTWGSVVFSTGGNATYTLNSDLYCVNFQVGGNTSTTQTINGNRIFISGNLTNGTVNLTSTNTGTTVFHLTGTGSQELSQATGQTSTFNNSIVINKPSGTLNIGSNGLNFRFGTRTLQWLSGALNIVTSPLIVSSCTLDTGSSLWSRIDVNTGVITLNSELQVSLFVLGVTGNVQFTGSFGFNADRLVIGAGRTITLQNTIEYKYDRANRNTGTAITITSNSGTIKAFLTKYGSDSEGNYNGTRIDSSRGNTIKVNNTATLTDTINWGYGEGNMLLAMLDKLKN